MTRHDANGARGGAVFSVGSLFSGIGGIDLAAQWAGFETAWFVEKEPFPQRVLRKHWPGVPLYDDVFECHDLPYVDVIVGGFPCQPFSVAGKRQGADDERFLLPEMLRIIREVKPYAVLFENVPGFPSLNDGAEFKLLLRALAEIRYDAEWGHLRASDCGAPHQRERWFCVAYRAGDDGRVIPAERRQTAQGRWESETVRGRGGAVLVNANGSGKFRQGSQRDSLGEWTHEISQSIRVNSSQLSITRSQGSKPAMAGVGQADTEGASTRDYRSQGRTPSQPGRSRRRNRGGDVVNACGTGREKRHVTTFASRPGHTTGRHHARGAGRTVESRMGRVTSRVSSRVDTNRGRGIKNNAISTQANTRHLLSALRSETSTARLQSRTNRVLQQPHEKEVLQQGMRLKSARIGKSSSRQSVLSFSQISRGQMRNVRHGQEVARPSYRRKSIEQLPGKPDDIVCQLSHQVALRAWGKSVEETVGLQNLWQAISCIKPVQQTLSALKAEWDALPAWGKYWVVNETQGTDNWPARPGSDQFLHEPPRVTSGRAPNRAARLKALGNAVVPQVVYPLLVAIREWLEERMIEPAA